MSVIREFHNLKPEIERARELRANHAVRLPSPADDAANIQWVIAGALLELSERVKDLVEAVEQGGL